MACWERETAMREGAAEAFDCESAHYADLEVCLRAVSACDPVAISACTTESRARVLAECDEPLLEEVFAACRPAP